MWVFRSLEKFGKSFKIVFKIEKIFFEDFEDIVVCFLRDLLEFGINICIGGLYWKNIDYLKKLLIIEIIDLFISDIYFICIIIFDFYENEFIVKVLVDFYVMMIILYCLRVVKYGGKYYVFDNEILWVLKGM